MRTCKTLAVSLSISAVLLVGSCGKNPTDADDIKQEWHLLGLEDESITAIAVDPVDENIIYAGSALHANEWGGLFKSTDGGASWDTLINGTIIRDIDIHPTNTQIVYVVGGGAKVIKTTDGGQTWVAADSGIRVGLYGVVGILVMDPLHPDTLYSGVAHNFGGDLFKSMDGGRSWQSIGSDVLNNGVTAIAINPKNTNVVYAGIAWIGTICKSTDGGLTWERLDFPENEIIRDLLVHPSNSEIIYASRSHDGFYTSPDGGASWQRTNTGLEDTIAVYQIAISPGGQVYFAGYSNGEYGVYGSSPDTIQWTMVGDRNFEGGINTIFVAKSGAVYAGTTTGIYIF